MIFNYDQKKGFSSIFNTKQEVPVVTQKIEDIFDLLESDPQLKLWNNDDIVDFVSDLDGANDSLIDFFKTSEKGKRELSDYQQYIDKSTKSTSKFSKATSVLKTIGGTIGSVLLNMGTSFLIEKGIEFAIKGIDALIVTSDELIQKGHDARNAIEEQSKAYTEQKSSLEQLTARYGELAKGVSVSGNKISNTGLSTEEYQEFLDISNQIATLAPSIGRTFDSQVLLRIRYPDNSKKAQKQLKIMVRLYLKFKKQAHRAMKLLHNLLIHY